MKRGRSPDDVIKISSKDSAQEGLKRGVKRNWRMKKRRSPGEHHSNVHTPFPKVAGVRGLRERKKSRKKGRRRKTPVPDHQGLSTRFDHKKTTKPNSGSFKEGKTQEEKGGLALNAL